MNNRLLPQRDDISWNEKQSGGLTENCSIPFDYHYSPSSLFSLFILSVTSLSFKRHVSLFLPTYSWLSHPGIKNVKWVVCDWIQIFTLGNQLQVVAVTNKSAKWHQQQCEYNANWCVCRWQQICVCGSVAYVKLKTRDLICIGEID